MKIKINISFYITWSKATALVMLILGFTMDYLNDRGGTVFMFTIPFFVAMITGRQVINRYHYEHQTEKQNND